MEINFSCLLAVVNTITFDLCYLLAICIHKRLLFIIIVFLSSSPISLCFFQEYFARFPFYMKLSFELRCDPERSFLTGVLPDTKTYIQCLKNLLHV